MSIVQKFLEFKKSDLSPIKSFKIKDSLNDKVWEGFDMKTEIREQLLKIAADFFGSLELEVEVKDIILTGSLANFNWSRYSDYDIHIIINFKDVNDDVKLVKKYVDAVKINWNKDHDIKIQGYEVEVYIQDTAEDHRSSGVFSLLNNKWKIKPQKIEISIDEQTIKDKAESIMKRVDDLETDYKEIEYDVFKEQLSKLWEKIKRIRKDGIEEGEFGVGNLVFKLLRRNNYINKIITLKRKSYDEQFK